VVTDRGGGRATRFTGLITVSQTTAVANGTRVVELVGPLSCLTNGINYDFVVGHGEMDQATRRASGRRADYTRSRR
jgi:hypothetical protein